MPFSNAAPRLLSVAVALGAAASLAAQPTRIAMTGVNVVDVVRGAVLSNRTVVIAGETVSDIRQTAAPADARVVNGSGAFLIPGLWDMHAHVQGSERGWLPLYLANGVTGIRDMGADLDVILPLREMTASGKLLGPRIVAAGPILDDAPGEWPLRMRVRNPEDGRAAVRLLAQRGIDFVKVHNFTPRDVFFAIAEEARRLGLPVAGHVPLEVTIEEGVDAGMRSIEHLSEDGRVWKACSGGWPYRPEACEAFFENMADRDVWQTPTLFALSEAAVIGRAGSRVPAGQLVYANKPLRDMWAGVQAMFLKTPEVVKIFDDLAGAARNATRDMAAEGVGILAGCDALVAGFCVHDELAMMVSAGMTPLAALQTATINPARYLGMEETLGTVTAGKRADLVLLDGNPLEDIANVRRVRAVVIGGRVLERTDLDRLLAEARLAARQ